MMVNPDSDTVHWMKIEQYPKRMDGWMDEWIEIDFHSNFFFCFLLVFFLATRGVLIVSKELIFLKV